MSHSFFALNIVLFFSCTVHHLGVKPEKTEYIKKQNNAFKKLDEYIAYLCEYNYEEDKDLLNNKQKDNKDNIKYAQEYLIGNKNNPFGIIDLYYCNLTEDYSITPLTILKDYKEKKKQDAVLEYIENILIINTHLHLQERTVLRYINNNDLIYTTPHIRNIFKEVNKIASEGKKNFKSGMTFMDVIYKAFDDTLKYKKQLISNMIRSGCPLPPNYNAESKEKFNKILLSIKHINEAMKIVCESYNNENHKLAITNAQYTYKKRLALFRIPEKVIDLSETSGKLAAAEFYISAAKIFQNTQDTYDDVIKNFTVQDPETLDQINEKYLSILENNKKCSIATREMYQAAINEVSPKEKEKKEALEKMLAYANKCCDSNSTPAPITPWEIVAQNKKGSNIDLTEAIRQVKFAYLLDKDPAKDEIDKAFQKAKEKQTSMTDLNELVKAIERKKPKDRNNATKNNKKTNGEHRTKKNTNKNKIDNTGYKNSYPNNTSHSMASRTFGLDQNCKKLEEENAVLQNKIPDYYLRNDFESKYTFAWSVSRWPKAKPENIRDFDTKMGKKFPYKNLDEEQCIFQKHVHNLMPVAYLLCAKDNNLYFFSKENNKDCKYAFATLEIGSITYTGILEIAIKNKKVYHLMFNKTSGHTKEECFRFRKSTSNELFEDNNNDAEDHEWCNPNAFEIDKEGDTYVITMDMPTSSDDFSNKPCRKLRVYPNKFDLNNLSNNQLERYF